MAHPRRRAKVRFRVQTPLSELVAYAPKVAVPQMCYLQVAKRRVSGESVHKSVKLLIVFAGACVLIAFVFPRRFSDPAEIAGLIAGMLPIWLVYGFDRIKRFAEAHARAILVAGILLSVAAIAAALARIDWCVGRGIDPCIRGDDVVTAAVLSTMVLGISLAVVSRRT